VDANADLGSIASLNEPQRRALYDIVVRHPAGVGRDEAARRAGISRSLAAYHLDRLVDDGLLEAEYRRLSGRTGPGAGRPAKVYRRARHDFGVTLPPRDYELAARLLASLAEQAIASGVDLDFSAAVQDAAAKLAEDLRARSADPEECPELEALERYGYEAYADDEGTIRLRNCPFHALTAEHRDLVCGLNHALIDAALRDAGRQARASLEPNQEHCCVVIRRAPD
jgi:predicted ArsR family transcriptional regulator